jgi:meso-butanediol dehydrogenase / (S,S)-butanediol dehydrogenase / diacetyl reductase
VRLDGRVCIVTGGAQGIGAAICEGLAQEGAAVVVGDLNETGAQAVAQRISARGGRAIAVGVDVAERQQVTALIRRTVDEYGALQIMFNNAGFNRPMRFLDVTEENWSSIMRVNALGVLLGIQEAAKQMISQGTGGKIINTASIAGRQGYPSFAPYSASKFAVVALTQAGARALADHGITVNAFAPGVVDTPLWEKLDRDLMAIGDTEKEGQALAEFTAGILLGRPARPADLCGTALYLASSDSDYMTGQVVAIDGGMVLV